RVARGVALVDGREIRVEREEAGTPHPCVSVSIRGQIACFLWRSVSFRSLVFWATDGHGYTRIESLGALPMWRTHRCISIQIAARWFSLEATGWPFAVRQLDCASDCGPERNTATVSGSGQNAPCEKPSAKTPKVP